ncbi:histidine phosphatase family protein [Deinococcus metallilatus]|uniref:2,3-bisphosphoglycerate-dependent phosphoglycerate mutase n=1 Tax=Deinococcus metallilatus TaxID=1211322 RepID=A0AAJ5F2N8_9DEIO|nr:histidine phosphatase family protein [Deinococcus metallilatus]MBB5296604.1 2,3-bisphosphoglycerate-dependent phosphoglycerate mutase [Deinococcus metallilatus]QBY08375.1 histidine phosphatase family protein [Deinococcus metallilatus]RXJ11174.1 histidine phosphatase family protein [Deinococcus metallilatus]TLK24665.1 histidine phosphatase family protein [Deinococcus metallilatus]GMA17521.1 phosphoglycerate mutase [Deinococcus metallilatus]
MRLLLIRHGQSRNNHLTGAPDYLQGRLADPPLTERGHQQALRLADWATRDDFCQRITHLYTSLTIRAVQTAAPLAQALGLKARGLTEAYECGGLNSGPAGGFTPVAGRDHASLQVDCPALLWPEDLCGQVWDGGCEPWEQARFAARAASVTARLRRVADEADVIALITHHDFAQYLTSDLLDLPALSGEALTFRLNNAATACIELGLDSAGTERRLLHWFNRVCHLTPDLITL